MLYRAKSGTGDQSFATEERRMAHIVLRQALEDLQEAYRIAGRIFGIVHGREGHNCHLASCQPSPEKWRISSGSPRFSNDGCNKIIACATINCVDT